MLRRNLPAGVRHLLRLGRHLVVRGATSPPIPAALMQDCRVAASRYDLIKLLPAGGRIVEVGSFKGAFARSILNSCRPSELHLIDLDFALLDATLRDDPRVRRHRGRSHEVLAGFPDEHFDWVYIDADHSFLGTHRDAEAAASKVKPGGYLVFNDFAHIDPYLGAYGVHRAVVAFAIAHNWPFRWWAYEGNGLYDVALERPLSGRPAAPAA